MMRKRLIIGIAVVMTIVCGILWYYYSQNSGKMDVYNTHEMIFGNYHEENITVVVNKVRIKDIQVCAEEIVEKCRNSDYKSVLFSYDKSIPNELHATVFLNERDVKKGKVLFSFSYEQEEANSEYNIVEHPEKFKLKISEEN